jgi:hypothetical protein
MRILVITLGVWKDTDNTGNTLNSIFSGSSHEFANIYWNPGAPDNDVCSSYFQITDKMLIDNVKHHAPIGNAFTVDRASGSVSGNVSGTDSFKSRFTKRKTQFAYLGREVLFHLSKWRNESLRKFVLDFDPDIIFAPSFASPSMLDLEMYIISILKKPAVSIVSDDGYSLRQLYFSPFYWIRRFWTRRRTRKFYKQIDLMYTASPEQKKEIARICPCEIKLLYKACEPPFNPIKDVGKPLRIIYGGGLYLNRWKSLLTLEKEAEKMALKLGVPRPVFNVYSSFDDPKAKKKLAEHGAAFHGQVTPEELKKAYAENDVALSLESFNARMKYITRLSFSTKIVDCLSSGCATLMYGPSINAGYRYLKENDAAICASSKKELRKMLRPLMTDPDFVRRYAEAGEALAKKNHLKEDSQSMVFSDFERLIAEHQGDR